MYRSVFCRQPLAAGVARMPMFDGRFRPVVCWTPVPPPFFASHKEAFVSCGRFKLPTLWAKSFSSLESLNACHAWALTELSACTGVKIVWAASSGIIAASSEQTDYQD